MGLIVPCNLTNPSRGKTMKLLFSIFTALLFTVGMASAAGFVAGGGFSGVSATTSSDSASGGALAHIGFATNESLAFSSADSSSGAIAGGNGAGAAGTGFSDANTTQGSTSTSFDATLGLGFSGASGDAGTGGGAGSGYVFVGF
jgi:hypothetical protein